ncbi:Sulfotransferase domain-containing protein [Mariprofundus aestuarium]|uniref:Sulfotransferase domain-containing protein n=2 Tax=Mariprofundus aestuarium TaxID=1921086 RepID=A0A2K8L227_MARES|nr:Sulfotransferase domain-containing protein [Mariprofundus aestuarium]
MPNFMIIGAAKSGTTSLHHYLTQHPQIFLPMEKELQFFTDNELYNKGKEFYLNSYFSGAESYSAIGEATPFYLHRPEIVIPRLKHFFPAESLKFIVLLRDPVKRAWSHYLHMVRLGLEPLSFEQALEAESERLSQQPMSWYSYFSDGLYYRQLEKWFNQFPKEHFLIITQDQLAENVTQTLEDVFMFLDVESHISIADTTMKNEAGEAKSKLLMRFLMGRPFGMPAIKRVLPIKFRRRVGMKLRQMNTRPVSSVMEMNAETYDLLRKEYDQDIASLERLLNRSFASWRTEVC